MKPLRIATRRSLLARRQAALVGDAIRSAHGLECEIVPFATRGDRHKGPLRTIGGKGLFTGELEAALRRGDVELAVHSAKDVPAVLPADFAVAAVPPRADPRDALVSRRGGLDSLPHGATVGTGSSRRAAQLKDLREDLTIVPIRGNVETRLGKALADEGDRCEAVVLAMAALMRSGLAREHAAMVHPLTVDQMVPAMGQGALLVQCLADRRDLLELAAPIDDADSRQALLAERSVVAGLGADCGSCLGVFIRPLADGWQGRGMARDGTDVVRVCCGAETAQGIVEKLLKALAKYVASDS